MTETEQNYSTIATLLKKSGICDCYETFYADFYVHNTSKQVLVVQKAVSYRYLFGICPDIASATDRIVVPVDSGMNDDMLGTVGKFMAGETIYMKPLCPCTLEFLRIVKALSTGKRYEVFYRSVKKHLEKRFCPISDILKRKMLAYYLSAALRFNTIFSTLYRVFPNYVTNCLTVDDGCAVFLNSQLVFELTKLAKEDALNIPDCLTGYRIPHEILELIRDLEEQPVELNIDD